MAALAQQPDSRVRSTYEHGLLRHLLDDHQLDDYDDFRQWNVERQSSEHLAWIEDIGALYDNLWVDECGRRFGKTVKWIVTDIEEALRRPGCRGMIATPAQKNIGGIIVPLTKIIFAGAPPEYFPKYHGSKDSEHQCLYIKATDSIIKLVGLDTHPDATRGQFLDFCHITEAAFVKGLYDLVTSVINPQFQKRPWAWLAMESSTAKAPDHDFNRQFRLDAKLRGTYRMRTIRDNPLLTEEEIRKEERRSGGKNSAQCRRELYCEEVRDDESMVVPEFEEKTHVVDPKDWPTPEYALAHEGFDPGTTDPFGMVGLYFDFMRQCIVVQWSWQKSNASDGEIVSVAQAFEREHWGSGHRKAGERRRELTITDATVTGDGKVWSAPDEALTYWDPGAWSLLANPYSRISDVDNRVILNLNVDHGMNVTKADKGPGSADADLSHLRTLFEARPARIVILRNGNTEMLIAQLRSGMWNTDDRGHRTDWERSKALGHLDCLAALKYVVRDVKWNRNPGKPSLVDVHRTDTHVPTEIREQARPQYQPTYGGRGKHGYAGRGARSGR